MTGTDPTAVGAGADDGAADEAGQSQTAPRRRTGAPLRWSEFARMLALALLGAVLAAGLTNAIGARSTLGPLDITTRITAGVGTTFDVGVAAVRTDTPGPVGLSITANDVRFSSAGELAQTLNSFGDVSAIAERLLIELLLQLGAFAAAGALVGLLLGLVLHRSVRGFRAPKRLRRNVYVAAVWLMLGTVVTSVLGPSVNLAGRSWETVRGLSVEGTAVPDLQVSGDLLNEAVRLVSGNEAFYERLRTRTAEVLAEVAAEDRERGLANFLFESDLHCNLGMARIIGDVAGQLESGFVLSGGDLTMSGTQLESLCTNIYLDRMPGGVPVVLVLGNHDSEQTGADLDDRGATVLAGEPVEVDGLVVVGDSDPNRSAIGEGTRLRGSETVEEYTARVEEFAEEAEPDVLLVHDPAHAASAIEEGLAPLVLSGHRHREDGPTRTGTTFSYTVNNSGGTGESTPSYGPLATTASVALFYYEPETGDVRGYRTVDFSTDGDVQASPYQELVFGKLANDPEGAEDPDGSGGSDGPGQSGDPDGSGSESEEPEGTGGSEPEGTGGSLEPEGSGDVVPPAGTG